MTGQCNASSVPVRARILTAAQRDYLFRGQAVLCAVVLQPALIGGKLELPLPKLRPGSRLFGFIFVVL